MRNTFTHPLPAIEGFIPTPCAVIETDGDSAWACWDYWVKETDSPEDKLALALAEKS